MGQGKSNRSQQILCFLQIELQRNGEGKHSRLAGLVFWVVVDFPERLFADVGPLVALDLRHMLPVNELQKRHRKGVVLLLQPIVQTLGRFTGHGLMAGGRRHFRHCRPFEAAADRGLKIQSCLSCKTQKPFQFQPLADLIGGLVIDAEQYPQFSVRYSQIVPNSHGGNGKHLILWEAKCSGGNQRKGNGGKPHFPGLQQSVQIARPQQRRLIFSSAGPDWPHGVKYIPARQVIPIRHHNFALVQCSGLFARLSQKRACRFVNGIVRPAGAGKAAVCGIHNGIRLNLRDVTAYNFKWHRILLSHS